MPAPRAGRLLAAGAALLLACVLGPALAQTRVVFPSKDGGGAEPVMLTGQWLRSAAVVGQARPAVVVLHGCAGLWLHEAGSSLEPELAALADGLVAAGWHVLLVDSLRPRGLLEACSGKIAARSIRPMHRVRDALGALEWLAQQQGVDAGHLALVGLEQGGDVALAAVDRHHRAVRQANVSVRAAIAVDPECGAEPPSRADAPAARRVLISPTVRKPAHAACRVAPGRTERWRAGADVVTMPARPGEGAAALQQRLVAAVTALLREQRSAP